MGTPQQLKVRIDAGPDRAVVALEGDMLADVPDALRQLAGTTRGAIDFDCAKLRVLSSYGAKMWTRWLATVNAPYEFSNCPTFLMDFASILPELLGKGRISSFLLPYRCQACQTRASERFLAADAGAGRTLRAPTCPGCRLAMECVVAVEDYAELLE